MVNEQRPYLSPSGKTHRGRDGGVATFATPAWPWARVVLGGRIHRVKNVIIRWNHWYGTREKPAFSYVFECGQRQTRKVYRAEVPTKDTWCKRCRTIDIMKQHDEESA